MQHTIGRPADHTFLDFMEQADPLEIRLHLLGYYIREHRRVTPPDIIFQAAQGDSSAQKHLLKTSFPNDADWQKTLRWLLALDITATKHMLIDILHRWYAEATHSIELGLLERRGVQGRLAPLALT